MDKHLEFKNRDEKINYLVDKVELMFNKMFISDNGNSLVEQIHSNTAHRVNFNATKKFITGAAIIAGFSIATSIFLFFQFGIK